MLKTEAIKLLGGTVSKAAEALGITPSAVSQWPEPPNHLADITRDRVQAELFRRAQAAQRRAKRRARITASA